MEPVVGELADRFKDDPSMQIVRIDGSKNDLVHPSVRIQGYPSMYFFQGTNTQNPIEYDGDRTTTAIYDFISKFRTSHQRHKRQQDEPVVQERSDHQEVDVANEGHATAPTA